MNQTDTQARIAMIPLRSGSKRVPGKNKRLLRGRPLAYYIIDAVVKSGAFNKSQIFINSEDIGFKKIAEHFGINFYHRPQHLASDTATNDDFVVDFLENYSCQTLFQFLATSPLLTPNTIFKFVDEFLQSSAKTGISVAKQQIECIYDNKPVNFVRTEQTPPSQNLTPVFSYACGLMAWDTKTFINNYELYGASYHGGNEKFFTYPLSKIESVDVDTEEDFFIVDAIMEKMSVAKYLPPLSSITKYWDCNSRLPEFEIHVPSILEKDGVAGMRDISDVAIIDISRILDERKCEMVRVVNSTSNSACLITQSKGEGNRLHYHPDWDEWWLILQGQWLFTIEGNEHIVSTNQLIKIPRNSWHQIQAISDEPATRLAVSRQDVVHAY